MMKVHRIRDGKWVEVARPYPGKTDPVDIADENARRQKNGLAPLVAINGKWNYPESKV